MSTVKVSRCGTYLRPIMYTKRTNGKIYHYFAKPKIRPKLLPPARDPELFNTSLEGLPIRLNTNGYIAVRVKVRRWEVAHRMVMAQLLGRPLRPGEEVHHDDEDKTNNDPANLILTTKSEHGKFHQGPRGYAPRPRYKRGNVG